MKYLFIVQGEGRGHLTQAMTLERLLRNRGHDVVGIMVGRSPQRNLPDFFANGVCAPVEQFESMNFIQSSSNRKPDMFKTVLLNSLDLYRFFPSIRQIRDAVYRSGADVVVNFYEIMAGLAYFFYGISVPMVCVGHQYLFMHKDFIQKGEKCPGSHAIDFFSRLTAAGSVKLLALSFSEMPEDKERKIVVVPPLLRPEVLELQPVRGEYIHGYMLNAGFSEDIIRWHKCHPEVELRFFWDNRESGKVHRVDDTLSFYLIDDKEFLHQMNGCAAYASTAGFESVCEAMYLGKPILMVPSHIEQEINAFDAVRHGAGISCDRFDLGRLLEFSKSFVPEPDFPIWVRSASERIIAELEDVR